MRAAACSARIMGTSVAMIEAHYGSLQATALESLLQRLERLAWLSGLTSARGNVKGVEHCAKFFSRTVPDEPLWTPVALIIVSHRVVRESYPTLPAAVIDPAFGNVCTNVRKWLFCGPRPSPPRYLHFMTSATDIIEIVGPGTAPAPIAATRTVEASPIAVYVQSILRPSVTPATRHTKFEGRRYSELLWIATSRRRTTAPPFRT